MRREGGQRITGEPKVFDRRNPSLTVITVVWNNAALIERTMKSVFNQTYQNIEYIVVDGGSTDGTLEIIEKYDQLIDYWVSESDSGIYDAMNKGIEQATGDWLNLMNCGDIFFSDEIVESVFTALPSEKVRFIYSDAFMKDLKNPEKPLDYWWTSFEMKSILHQCVIYKKDLHNEFGKYISCKNLIVADYLFFNQIPRQAVWKFEKEAIAIYQSEDGISRSATCYRQVVCVDYLFNRMTYRRLLIELILDFFYSKKKRKEFQKLRNRIRNKIIRFFRIENR